MKQRIELFEFFIDKVPIQKVEYLEGSQILTNFSVHFASSSTFQENSQNEKSGTEKTTVSNDKSLLSTISVSNKYKEIFLNIENNKKKRRHSISQAWKK
jgi:hypothetical protein